VIEDDQMVVTKALDRARVRRDRVGIGADLELREDRADLHRPSIDVPPRSSLP